MALFKKKAETPKGNLDIVDEIVQADEQYIEEPSSQSIDDEMKDLQEKLQRLQKQKETPKIEQPKTLEPNAQEVIDMIEANNVRNAQLLAYFRRRFGI